jgi:MFS family permease
MQFRYGWDERMVGFTMAAVGLCAMIVQGGLIGRTVQRFGERTTLIVGLGFGIAGFTVFGLASSGPLFWSGIPLLALWGFASPSALGLMSRRVSASEQGRLQGANSSLMGVANMLGPGLFTRDQKIRILLQLTAARHPDLPDVPLAGAFATRESNARVLALFVERQQYGRPFLAPPGTPAAIVAAYREAFGKLAKDAEFIREAQAARLIIKIASGDEVTARVNRIYDNPKPIIEQATVLLRSVPE